MSLIRWKPNKTTSHDPFQEFFSFWPSNELFGLDEVSSFLQNKGTSAVDVSEDEKNIYVKADLPGFEKKDIQLSLDNGYLQIQAERKAEEKKKEKTYHRVERSYEVVRRSISLGSRVDQSKIKANYKNGVLEITVPKSKEHQPKLIDIDGS